MRMPVRTNSMLHMWYLRLFRHHTVSCMIKRPVRPLYLALGIVMYKTTWVMLAA